MAEAPGSKEDTRSLLKRLTDPLFELYGRIAGDELWSGPLLLGLVLGFVNVIVWGSLQPSWVALPVGLLVAGASLAVGALFGFVFGIPKVRQEESKERPQPPGAPKGDVAAKDTGASGEESAAESRYDANTNLELISDWLTKIIVGVGLVELRSIPDAYRALADYVAASFAPPAPSPTVAVMMAYFAIGGFLVSYLWARISKSLEIPLSPRFKSGVLVERLLRPTRAECRGASGRLAPHGGLHAT